MLEFKEVSKEYSGGMFGTKRLKAVDEVSFCVAPHERVGLVGESGCGKSTVARMASRLLLPSAGELSFNGKNLMKMDRSAVKAYRRQVQMIFQNPQQSFSPRMKLYDTLAEPLRVHKLAKGRTEELARIRPAMERVGLTEDIFSRFPHEISGGQAQRLAIMRILMLSPKLIIADEPTSMLDVSVQAQILQLLSDTMDRLDSSLLFISHDLEVVRAVCDRIIVMQNGKICEIDTTENIFEHPKHEYTSFLVKNYR